MSKFSNYLEDHIINHMLRNQAFTPPAAVYLALFTAVTGLEADNPSAEAKAPGVHGYARQAIALDAAAGGNGISANTDIEEFTAAGGDWGAITHVAIVDHQTNVTWGTNVHVLMWGELTVSRTINDGDTLRFAVGDIDITVD